MAKTFSEKQIIRYRMVYAAMGTLVLIPFIAIGLVLLGVDPSGASSIFSTASLTLGAVVIGHFTTTIKDDNASTQVE